jgi:MATE family multidrug resistance protein
MTAYCGQCLFSTSAAYVSTFAAQHHGAGEDSRCGGWAWSAMWLGLIGGGLMLLVLPWLPSLFALMDPQPLVLADTVTLCSWWLCCTCSATVIAAIGGFYAGTGRTAMVLFFNGLLLALNVGLNALLIFGGLGIAPLGVAGAGIGTFTASMTVAVVAGLCFMNKSNRTRFGTWSTATWHSGQIRHFLRFALPQGMRNLLENGAWTFFTFAVGRLGTEALAANNIVINWNLLSFIPMIGMSQAIGITVGQAMGRQRVDLAISATRKGMLLEMAYALMVGISVLTLSDHLIRPFLHGSTAEMGVSDQIILTSARHLLIVAALWGVGDALNLAYTGALAGAGDTRWPMAASLIGATLFLILPLCLVLHADPAMWLRMGIEPVVMAWLVTLLFVSATGIAMALRFRNGAWRRMSIRQGIPDA